LKTILLILCNFVGSYAIILGCWKEDPEERPDFSKLVVTISLTLEAAVGYMNLSPLTTQDDHPLVSEVEVKTRPDGSGVQSSSESGRQYTAVMCSYINPMQ